MSDNEFTTPVSAAFELQRNVIEQGQQAFENGVEFQKRLNSAFLDGVGATEETQRRTVELAERGIHAYLDAVEQSVPGSEDTVAQLRGNVDESFDAIYDAHGEAFAQTEETLEEGVESYDELATDYLEALNEQIESLLEAHADIEAQTVEAFERAEERFAEMQDQLEEQGEEFQEQFERQFEQFQGQLEELQNRLEEVQQRTADGIDA